MTPALARRLGKAVALLGSPEDGEALAAARAIGRTLTAAGMDWHGFARLVTTEAERLAEPPFSFAALSPRAARTARKRMAVLARQPGVTAAERARLELLRARLLGAKDLNLSAGEILWLDTLWKRELGGPT